MGWIGALAIAGVAAYGISKLGNSQQNPLYTSPQTMQTFQAKQPTIRTIERQAARTGRTDIRQENRTARKIAKQEEKTKRTASRGGTIQFVAGQYSALRQSNVQTKADAKVNVVAIRQSNRTQRQSTRQENRTIRQQSRQATRAYNRSSRRQARAMRRANRG